MDGVIYALVPGLQSKQEVGEPTRTRNNTYERLRAWAIQMLISCMGLRLP